MRVAALVTVGVASPSRLAISPGVIPSLAHRQRRMNCWPSCTPWRENAAAVATDRACLASQNAVWKSSPSSVDMASPAYGAGKILAGS